MNGFEIARGSSIHHIFSVSSSCLLRCAHQKRLAVDFTTDFTVTFTVSPTRWAKSGTFSIPLGGKKSGLIPTLQSRVPSPDSMSESWGDRGSPSSIMTVFFSNCYLVVTLLLLLFLLRTGLLGPLPY
jgi:hypothetical protein